LSRGRAMSVFLWKREYKLGIEAIDSQHKTIMDKFNALYDAISAGAEPGAVSRSMRELIDYSEVHFRDEEELFARNGYPKADQQKEAHRYFKERADAIYSAYLLDPTIDSLEIVNFLKDWIENHLLTLDMDYKEFLVRLEAIKRMR
jgi:hemerythrin